MSPEILVVGLGNPLREDDGIGAGVVNMLAGEMLPAMSEKVHLAIEQQIDLVLASLIIQYNHVIFVDAAEYGSAGPVRLQKVKPSYEPPGFSSHIGSLPFLLAITSRVYGKSPECYLVAVEGSNFAFGRGLSVKSKQNAALGVKVIIDLISQLLPPD